MADAAAAPAGNGLGRARRAVTAKAGSAGSTAVSRRRSCASRRSAWIFLLAVGMATFAVCVLFYTKSVTVKLLPFDNKSEIAVVLDLPRGAPSKTPSGRCSPPPRSPRQLPEITSIAGLCGHAGAVQFQWPGAPLLSARGAGTGRSADQPGAARRARSRASHAIALDLRARLKG